MAKTAIYTVQAFRWGDLHEHSYIVGVYSKKHAAIEQAKKEKEYRGGKYECEVQEWILGDLPQDNSPGMPSKSVFTTY